MDFTSIPPKVCTTVTKLDYDYNEDWQTRAPVRAFYLEQKDRSEGVFSLWLEESNAKFIKEINDSIRLTFNNHEALYGEVPMVWSATVVLGIQPSDNDTTLDMIHSAFKETVQNLEIVRIKPIVTTRIQLSNWFEELDGRKEKLLVIVEQTEKMQSTILNSLLTSLDKMSERRLYNQVMVLFCMQASHLCPASTLPLVKMKHVEMIIKDIGEGACKRIDEFLHGAFNLFRLGPNLLNAFSDYLNEEDNSILNAKYLYDYSMFEHYHFKDMNLFVSAFNDDLLKYRKASLGRSKLKPKRRVSSKGGDRISLDRSSSNIESLLNYHLYVMNQLSHYYTLIRDEVGEYFPSSMLDMYKEVTLFESLDRSEQTINAILRLRSFPSERVVRRIDSLIETASHNPKKFPDIRAALENFKEKFENNEDCDELRLKFQTLLIGHLKYLRNPLLHPLSPAIYYTDYHTFAERTMPALRFDFIRIAGSSNFGILYEKISNSSEEMSERDLFDEYKLAFQELKAMTRKSTTSSTIKMKKTPKRFTRSSLHPEPLKPVVKIENLDEEKLMAVFLDLLDSMQQQGIIERDLRKSKSGILKRSAWPPYSHIPSLQKKIKDEFC